MYSKGQIVFSKKGRDKGLAFIVYDYDEAYVYLVDGKLRKLEKPKKKKMLHVQPAYIIDEMIKSKLEKGEYILDSDIRKALAKYNGKKQQI